MLNLLAPRLWTSQPQTCENAIPSSLWYFGYSSLKILPFFSPISSFIYQLLIQAHEFLFFSNGLYLLLYLLSDQMSQVWAVGAPLSWLLCPCDTHPSFLSSSLLSSMARCILSLPQPKIWALSCSMLLECFCFLTLSAGRVENTCKYIHKYIHTPTNIHVVHMYDRCLPIHVYMHHVCIQIHVLEIMNSK